MEEEEEEEYISKIIIELQPRSIRGYRRLFGIRENKSFNKELFDIDKFRELFVKENNKKVLRRGQHIHFNNFIVAVKAIQRAPATSQSNTEVEFRLRGLPLTKEKNETNDENKGKLNQSFIDDQHSHKIRQANLDQKIEEVYSCYCSECKKILSDGDFYIKSGNWRRPILCLSCYELLFTEKCVRCRKSISFDRNSLSEDGLSSIRFVENNGLYWHSECCVCVTCLDSLVGKKFYQDQIYNQLFCLDHIPQQYL